MQDYDVDSGQDPREAAPDVIRRQCRRVGLVPYWTGSIPRAVLPIAGIKEPGVACVIRWTLLPQLAHRPERERSSALQNGHAMRTGSPQTGHVSGKPRRSRRCWLNPHRRSSQTAKTAISTPPGQARPASEYKHITDGHKAHDVFWAAEPSGDWFGRNLSRSFTVLPLPWAAPVATQGMSTA